ncbi:hypothetical protein [Rhodococcus sp. RS1C4]|nr:hypothetical protein [Rhodococcus sp. RS1C4]
MSLESIIISVVGPTIVALLAWWTQRGTSKRSADSAATEQWQKMLSEQRETFTAQLTPMKDSIDRLDGEVRELREALRSEERRFRFAVLYIRALLDWVRVHAPGLTPPPAPEPISNDI